MSNLIFKVIDVYNYVYLSLLNNLAESFFVVYLWKFLEDAPKHSENYVLLSGSACISDYNVLLKDWSYKVFERY